MSLTNYLRALLILLASYAFANYVAVAQQEETAAANNETSAEQEPVVDTPIEQSFEDYEASEQISEDLSVAFPVDI